MSLIVCVYVEEGIVLASDSRTSYNSMVDNKVLIGIHSTNTTNKTFICPNNCGISACGDASIQNKPITGFIEAFIRENIKKDTDIDEIPELIKNYFVKIDSSICTNFIIAGYKETEGRKTQRIYKVKTNSDEMETVNTNYQGAIWDGEILTLSKLLTPLYNKNIKTGEYELFPESDFGWSFYTLQDAVDFAKYAIRTTIDTMRFQMVPETVGGPIDILIIRPEETKWLTNKELKG